MGTDLRVTVWHEFRHEKKNPAVKAIYPEGMHVTIATALKQAGGLDVRTATLDEKDHGLSDDVIDSTDVMVWWGHMAHDEVQDAIAEKVRKRVLAGMGLVALHSAHYSKVFRGLMGTSCSLKWREADDREILWVTAPGHPVVEGIDDHIIIPAEEMYGEHFDIPEPNETVFISSFTGGEVFRSGVGFRRGAGKIFYFRPGHETYPTYHNKQVQRVIANAVRWVAPVRGAARQTYGNRQPLK